MRRGIILAGGAGKRLRPMTLAMSKHLLLVYDKPLIYYSLSTLMLARIRDVLLISTARDAPLYRGLFGDGGHLGLSISYAVQDCARGIPEAFLIGANFIGSEPVSLVLGDNIFYGVGLSTIFDRALKIERGASIFTYEVADPRPFGVATFASDFRATSIEEKPEQPKSRHAVTGLYFYDNRIVEIARSLKPSPRGELEITDANRTYLEHGELFVHPLGRGFAWLDSGTPDSLLDAANFVATVERRQGLKVACLEEIAYRNGWISLDDLFRLAEDYGEGDYSRYLRTLAADRSTMPSAT